MNKERILRVADAIEKHELAWLGFNMEQFFGDVVDEFPESVDRSGYECGTVACIAGWSEAVRLTDLGLSDDVLPIYLFGRNGNVYSGLSIDQWPENSIPSQAAKWLGLTGAQASALFFVGGGAIWSQVDAAQAVRTLRHFAETGAVDWMV